MSDKGFDPGCLFMTAGVKASGISIEGAYLRHCMGDWGDLGDDDKVANDEAAACNLREGRIVSAYNLEATKIYIITVHDDEVGENRTTIMLAEEY